MTTGNTVLFSEWLKAELAKRSLSAQELHERAKISRAATYFYLSGRRIPDQNAVTRIIGVLEIAPEDVPAFERRKNGRPFTKKAA